jgi:hypothetical protein
MLMPPPLVGVYAGELPPQLLYVTAGSCTGATITVKKATGFVAKVRYGGALVEMHDHAPFKLVE